ncbi:MAG: hypothetical protein ACLQK8_28210 [Streptosporangiaceae bacterium]|jgi:hypothetical protein
MPASILWARCALPPCLHDVLARRLQRAVNDVGACTDLPAVASELGIVVRQRISDLTAASALVTGALSSGTSLNSDLTAALHASLRADTDCLTWAQEMDERGCANPVPADKRLQSRLHHPGQAKYCEGRLHPDLESRRQVYGYPTGSPGGI